MYTFGYLFMAVAKVLDFILVFYMWIVIARAVLSWVNPDPYNPIVRFITNVTDPVMRRIRAYLPLDFGGIDFSPIIVILGIVFIRTFVVNSLMRFSATLL